ncbi:MAG TPA: histidine kinase [Solirubrobacteraceae bacterium]|nr:histidine kinase [Solirubrobacteraceae bacterium]
MREVAPAGSASLLRSLRPRRWDAISAAVVALLVLPEIHPRHGGPGSVAFDLAFAVPLLWRSRWPFGVFLVTAGTAFVQWILGMRVLGDFALLIALYTVASREDRRTALTAAAILEVGVILALARWFHDAHIRSFIGLTGLIAAACALGMNVRGRRLVLESLEERAARLELERDQQGKLAAAAERARIARELHDVVAHNLTVMIALSDGAGYALRDDPDEAERALETAASTGRLALAEMRRLLGVLREDSDGRTPERDPQPGVPEIDRLVEQVRAAGLPVSYRVSPDARELPEGIQLTLFRIVQEALTNTLKHAGPSATAELEVLATGADVTVSVADTGPRLSAPPAVNGGSGLRGMRERASVYSGVVEAGPRPEGGWRVAASLPLLDAEREPA